MLCQVDLERRFTLVSVGSLRLVSVTLPLVIMWIAESSALDYLPESIQLSQGTLHWCSWVFGDILGSLDEVPQRWWKIHMLGEVHGDAI